MKFSSLIRIDSPCGCEVLIGRLGDIPGITIVPISTCKWCPGLDVIPGVDEEAAVRFIEKFQVLPGVSVGRVEDVEFDPLDVIKEIVVEVELEGENGEGFID